VVGYSRASFVTIIVLAGAVEVGEPCPCIQGNHRVAKYRVGPCPKMLSSTMLVVAKRGTTNDEALGGAESSST
jgi:hypothetical protein